MRKYTLISLLLVTTGVLFFALHQYVEVSVLAHAKAQTNGNTSQLQNDNGHSGADICDNCDILKTQLDRNSVELTEDQRAALAACGLNADSCSREAKRIMERANQ